MNSSKCQNLPFWTTGLLAQWLKDQMRHIKLISCDLFDCESTNSHQNVTVSFPSAFKHSNLLEDKSFGDESDCCWFDLKLKWLKPSKMKNEVYHCEWFKASQWFTRMSQGNHLPSLILINSTGPFLTFLCTPHKDEFSSSYWKMKNLIWDWGPCNQNPPWRDTARHIPSFIRQAHGTGLLPW